MTENAAKNSHAAKFVGRWVGQTMGWNSPAHVWEITALNEVNLEIVTRWEDGREVGRFFAHATADEPAFIIKNMRRTVKAVLIDSQHFIIPEWDTNDTRNHEGPDYDVVFSRPGLAELTARNVWRKFRANIF